MEKTELDSDESIISLDVKSLYKVFLRYVDDIVRTVKGNPGLVLEAAYKLHPNLQFTIEDFDSNGNLAFLDLHACHLSELPLLLN